MNAVEFTAELNEAGTLHIPSEVAKKMAALGFGEDHSSHGGFQWRCGVAGGGLSAILAG